MANTGYAFFETAIGRCAIIWGAAGIRAVYLPERDESLIHSHIGRKFKEAREASPPPEAASAITRITSLLRGGDDDLASVRLDMTGIPYFNRCIYDLARKVPPGATATYGEIAERFGDAQIAQAVGQALGRNPFPIIVPCHRILAAGGKTGGFSAPGGVATKLKMLEIEGARRDASAGLFDETDPRWRGAVSDKAFSSDVDTGSREENASKPKI
jgi:methylated-DNA-[protein]-cysteine S-methyltransferase